MRKTMMLSLMALGLAPIVLLGGCETAATPTKVTRFHLGAPIDRGAVMVVANPAATNIAGLEADVYAAALREALAGQGFVPGTDSTAPLVASFTVGRTVREIEPPHAPITIGIGAGGGGSGVGGGASVGFGVGKKRGRDAYVTELGVQIRRGAAGEILWEGRALTEADTRSAEAQPLPTARKLAQALFKGFPGESGRTISVR